MTETYLEQLVPEKDFAGLLESRAEAVFRLSRTLRATHDSGWSKRDFYQLHTEADDLESFLDDFGARYNRTYNYLTELTASLRGFALAGLTMEHLVRRLLGYGVIQALPRDDQDVAQDDIRGSLAFVRDTIRRILDAMDAEAVGLGLSPPVGGEGPGQRDEQIQRFSLPRNVGQEDLQNEEQKIAEVASKYLQACSMLRDAGVRRIEDAKERTAFLADRCTEEQARVYEATVHNLQSAYDTHIKNTVLEADDERLPLLRGHVSSALHLLEAVTQLTHFVERHESNVRSEAAERKLAELIDRSRVHDVTLNALLYWADRFMQLGRELAEELLPSYTNVQLLEVEVAEGITLHARPVSLIVAIVNHYGTPVEMEVAGKTCHAGSILELMIAVGSHPEERCFVFRGDEHPLRDIRMLFEGGLGERGIDALPDGLSYLRAD